MGDADGKRSLLKAPEVAKRLAVSIRTVREFVALGELKVIRLARKAVRFDPRDLDAFIDSRRQGA